MSLTPKIRVSQVSLGQRRGLSAIDAQQMNLLYRGECSGGGGAVGTFPPPPPPPGKCLSIISLYNNSNLIKKVIYRLAEADFISQTTQTS